MSEQDHNHGKPKGVTVMPRQSKSQQEKCKLKTAPEPEIAGAQLFTPTKYLIRLIATVNKKKVITTYSISIRLFNSGFPQIFENFSFK